MEPSQHLIWREGVGHTRKTCSHYAKPISPQWGGRSQRSWGGRSKSSGRLWRWTGRRRWCLARTPFVQDQVVCTASPFKGASAQLALPRPLANFADMMIYQDLIQFELGTMVLLNRLEVLELASLSGQKRCAEPCRRSEPCKVWCILFGC